MQTTEKPQTSLKSFKSSDSDVLPSIESATIDLARDFELPGFPTRKSGIRNSMQITIMNTFSRRAAFLAILDPNFMLPRRTSWVLQNRIDGISLTCKIHAYIHVGNSIIIANAMTYRSACNCQIVYS